jgi:hypothetical protein
MNIDEIIERDMRDAERSAGGAAAPLNNDDGSKDAVGVFLAAAIAVILAWAIIGTLARLAIKSGLLAGGVL